MILLPVVLAAPVNKVRLCVTEAEEVGNVAVDVEDVEEGEEEEEEEGEELDDDPEEPEDSEAVTLATGAGTVIIDTTIGAAETKGADNEPPPPAEDVAIGGGAAALEEGWG